MKLYKFYTEFANNFSICSMQNLYIHADNTQIFYTCAKFTDKLFKSKVNTKVTMQNLLNFCSKFA